MSNDSKFLARVLRHAPDEIGLSLGEQGWVRVEELLRAMKKAGRPLTRSQLEEIVATNDKSRFTLRGEMIRAAQGHSVDVDLGLPALEPPETLYHGTASRNLDAIFATGLVSGRRRQVHLSPDPATASRVGERHGKPTVLRVDAGRMHADGYAFYRADNGVWLTDEVPASYLGFGMT
ncbi:RNA--NAD 2'-phosphotransferase [Thioclava sp. DLFJ5-1]|uniref:RNA 2'-phosphotransferase n=1 Tax=Thioclava sp. DLFJ5-1 TaxID=1915314 RepID=UPI0009970A81|nr:RNA 2'-phosphotransferase [Thioclava sp. DLFJ5-1]OOY18940.1 RNA--NAD 2'-phosphotransferase [Thioclava sp. DLFJ5-1]